MPTPGGPDIPIRKEFPDFLYNFFINSSAFFLSLTLVDSISVIPFERATLSDNNIFLYKSCINKIVNIYKFKKKN